MGADCLRDAVTDNNAHLDQADKVFKKQILEQLGNRPPSVEQQKRQQAEFATIVEEIAETTFADLILRSEPLVVEQHEFESSFLQSHNAKWENLFRLLRATSKIASEAGQMMVRGLRHNTEFENSYKLKAIVSLHARAIRTFSEILCLLENGFADGAIARWRSLHELSTVAFFLCRQDEVIAERYLASRDCLNYRSAVQYQKFFGSVENDLLSASKGVTLEAKSLDAKKRFGTEINSDWGWAKPALEGNRLDFSAVEAHLKHDHWRPFFRWANQEVHAGYVPPDVGLGVQGSKLNGHLIGHSNLGIGAPATMSARSLHNATAALALLNPTLDRLAVLKVMDKFANKLGVMNQQTASHGIKA